VNQKPPAQKKPNIKANYFWTSPPWAGADPDRDPAPASSSCDAAAGTWAGRPARAACRS